jgi:serine/threonine-protein kinase
VYVTDFGLARATNSTSTQHMTSGLLLGTVAYLSPEQVKPGVSDERSDVYAAGIVLYEMLTGSPPFTGTEAISVAYRHVNEDVPEPSAAVPGISPELDRAVLAATSRDPSRRPADAAALLELVRAVPQTTTSVDLNQTLVVPVAVGAAAGASLRHDTAVGAPLSAPTSAPAAPGVSTGSNGAGAPGGQTPELYRKRSRRRGFIALAIVLLLALAAGALAWWLGSGRYTTVPRLTGLSSQSAEARLQEEGLQVAYGDEQFSEIVKAGDVIATDPEQGSDVRSGGTVTLILSKGPERYDVPSVVGKPLDLAKQVLQDTKLTVGQVTKDWSDTLKQGLVISSSPREGTTVRVDTSVDLVVSKGPPPVDVPNLVGTSEADAKAALASSNLKYEVSAQKRSMQYAAGEIISQTPSAGASVEQGTTVAVVVSTGPPLVEVPNVVQKPVDIAVQILQDAGLKASTYDLLGVSPLNRVADQNPEAGSMAPKGSTVRLGLV